MKAKNFEYTIIKSKRKSLSIAVLPNMKVKVRAPLKATEKFIFEVIEEKTPWILKKLAFFEEFGIKKENNKILFLGKNLQLIFQVSENKSVTIKEEEIIILGKNPEKVFEDWLKAKVNEVFSNYLEECYSIFSKYFNYKKPILKIRKMKSRWGSLSSLGIITLNFHLIKTPPECLHYVIMHELCHLKHQNHSCKFRELETFFVPNAKELNKKLKQFGAFLKY